MGILDTINLPQDLKKLNIKELSVLSEEIRKKIIDTAKENGGHLSANLGIIETTLAIHYVFDLPTDKLIFDVGHQCYAHKILSGRYAEFQTIRQDGGLSGFPNREESRYDAFSTGHAGTSIAAGVGICRARDKKGENYSVIDLVGDGALVNGLNLEAITSKKKKPKNFLVILNDNGMSISSNVNGLYQFISKGTTKRSYIRSKNLIKKIFKESFITKFLRKIKNFIKRLVNKNLSFDQFGFKYVGVVDGNNIKELVGILQRVKNTIKERAVFLHIKTQKGKGLEVAEVHSDVYHGVGKNFDTSTGNFSSALGDALNEIIDKDDSVVAITAGMKDGTGLKPVEEKHKENFCDVGIAEEYAVTLAAGMAVGGLKPVVAIYSTFMQRAYDQILHDVCIQNLPVIFCLDRAGFSGADGVTHQGLYDLSYLTHMPNMTVLAPSTVAELKDSLEYALDLNSPVAIRYPKNCRVTDREILPYSKSLWEVLTSGGDTCILAVGPKMIDLAFEIKEKLAKDITIVNARCVKPLDSDFLNRIKDKLVVTLEENSVIGGFGSLVSGYYSRKGYNTAVKSFGAKDEFVPHGLIKSQMERSGLTADNIVDKISKF